MPAFKTYVFCKESRIWVRKKLIPTKQLSILFAVNFLIKWVRLNYVTTHHHPPPAKIYPPPTTTHHQPKWIHHHAPPPTTSQNMSTTTQNQPRYIHQHPPPPTNSQNLFLRNPFIRISSHCLTAT